MRRTIIFLSLFIVVHMANNRPAVADPPQKIYHILIINSLRHSIVWTPDSYSQLVRVLLESKREGEDFQIHLDFMYNKKPVLNPDYLDFKYRQLAEHYSKLNLDLIICVGPEALDLLLERAHKHFSEVPVLFAGVGMELASKARQNRYFAGIAADWNLMMNIELAIGLFPETQKIVFVHDGTAFGKQFVNDALTLAPKFPGVEFSAITDISMAKMLHRVGKLKKGTLLFIGPISIQVDGEMSDPDKTMRQIIAASPVPTFSLWKAQHDAGIIGGYFINESEYGGTIGKTALSIIRAGGLSGVTVPQRTPASYIFDWQQIQCYSPSAQAMPEGYTIINQPSRFVRAYRNQIFGALALVVVLTAIIVTLSINTMRRKKAEHDLKESKQRLNLILTATSDGIWDWDLKKDSIYCSPRCYTMLGYESGEIKPVVAAAHELIHPDDIEQVVKAFTDNLEGKTPGYDAEFRIRTKDGSWRWVEGMGAVIERETDETPSRMAGTLTDITERKKAEQERLDFERNIDEQKRQFYRQTIVSVTDGKLEICEYQEIDEYIDNAELSVTFSSAEETPAARKTVESYFLSKGLEVEKTNLFIMGVGEAITNVIKHADYGVVYAGSSDEGVWAAVKDNGPGIESLLIPKVVLLQGYSTKPSLGVGYSIMLDVADRILLATGPSGTSVLLFKYFVSLPTRISINQDPKAWGEEAEN